MTLSSRVGVCESEILEESPSRSRGVERQYRSDRLGRLAKRGYVRSAIATSRARHHRLTAT